MNRLNSIKTALESRRLVWAAKTFVAILVCYFAVAFLYVSLSRINYHFTLEWLEGASLLEVQRILSGQLLYVQPSLAYVPFIYSPFYFYVSALLAKVIGFSFLPLRLVSFFSTLGCSAFIYLIVRRHTGDAYASLMAAGSFMTTFKIADAWFDLARVDMLALSLMLAAIFLVETKTTLNLVLAGLAISLACLTKQTYLILLLPFFIYGFSLHGARSLISVFATTLLLVASHLWLDWIHQGWYSFFVYTLGFGKGQRSVAGGLHFADFQIFWVDSIIKTIPVLSLFCALYFLANIRDYKARLGMLALAGGMILMSWAGIVNIGGYRNVLLPAYAIISICAWLFISEISKNAAVSNLLRTGVLLLCSIQLITFWYPLADQIPTPGDFRAGQALVEEIRQAPGDVFIPFDNYLAFYAGKQPFANFGPMGDLNGALDTKTKQEWKKVDSELRTYTGSHKFGLIILDENAPWGSAERYFENNYEQSPITYEGDAFFPVAGWQIRPNRKYIPAQ